MQKYETFQAETDFINLTTTLSSLFVRSLKRKNGFEI